MVADTTDRQTRNAARAALLAFGILPKRLTSLAHRHNDVFHVHAGADGEYVLRIQNDVMDDAAALSQLLWLDSLASETDIAVPRPILTLDGDAFTRVPTPRGICRAVLLTWIPGRRARTRGPRVFGALARLIARMHLHAERFRPPARFTCRTLDADWIFGRRCFARRVSAKSFLSREDRRMLQRAKRQVEHSMRTLGRGRKHFGIIHADLGVQNACFHHGVASPIDFDEFGKGWYLFDLAESFRTRLSVDNYSLQKRIALDAYQTVRKLDDLSFAHFDSFMLASNLQFLNWSFEHARNKHDLRWTRYVLDLVAWLSNAPHVAVNCQAENH